MSSYKVILFVFLILILIPSFFHCIFYNRVRKLKKTPFINNKNMIIVTTTMPNNIISDKRRNNIVKMFSDPKVSILLNHGISKKDNNKLSIHDIMFLTIKNSIELFNKTSFEYAIICDDDFFPINNFIEELNKTVQLLPNDWRSLHLCPGYLWGREFRDESKIGSLNIESSIDVTDMDYHESGRFYLNCNGKLNASLKMWLGGPIAFLIKKEYSTQFLREFTERFKKIKEPNDVILTKMLTKKDFICRSPQLGYEKEEGGTTL